MGIEPTLDMGGTRLNAPTGCELWRRPTLIEGPIEDRFDLLEVVIDESHHRRYLLECRECGQRYFYEFYEQVDWEGGDDPQYITYVPVESDEELEALKAATPVELLDFSPRLQRDWPSESAAPTTRWVGRK